jgi:hypothetical protein
LEQVSKYSHRDGDAAQPNAVLSAALDYAAQDWPVFPCRAADKTPLTPHGFKDATTDPEQIKRWWRKSPTAMIGLPMGQQAFCIDLDRKEPDKDGLVTWANLEAEHGPAPKTRSTDTPSGGRHLLFKSRPGYRSIPLNKLAPGIEVKASGGYVIAPPSVMKDGRAYRGNGCDEIAEPPPWLEDMLTNYYRSHGHKPDSGTIPTQASSELDALDQQMMDDIEAGRINVDTPNDPPPSQEKIQAALNAIPPDNYWIWLEVGAALYHELGESGHDLYVSWSARSSKFNAKDCQKKWHECAKMTSFTAGTIFHYAGEHDPEWWINFDETEEVEEEAPPVAEPVPPKQQNGAGNQQQKQSTKQQTGQQQKQDDRANRALSLKEWLARKLPAPDYLLANVITTTSRMLLWAPTGLGKTMLAIAMGMAMSHGNGYLHWDGVRPVRVLYIDGEMSRQLLQERLHDEAERLGAVPDNFFILSKEDCVGLAPLNTVKGQQYINAKIKELGGVDFIIFDNIMVLIAGDQKDEECWRNTIPLVLSLTRRKIGQLWIHHTGHDETHGYGTKTREWQMDTVMQLEAVERPDTDVSFQLHFGKARQRRPTTRDQFEDVRIALIDDEWIYQRAAGSSRQKLSPVGEKFLKCLLELVDNVDLVDLTNAPPGISNVHGCVAAELGMWKAQCGKRGLLGDNSRTQRAMFSKYKLELITKNWIACNETSAWVLP